MEKSLLRYGLGKLVVLRHIDDIVHSLLFQKISGLAAILFAVC
jgi:hypothetical protein